MELNLTIFVQIGNFFIGFFLIKNFLLKPAIQFLQEEDRKKDDLSKDISDQEALLDAKVEKKKNRWTKCQEYFRDSCPKPLEKKVFALDDERKEPVAAEISSAEVEQLAQHVKKALIERVEYVRK